MSVNSCSRTTHRAPARAGLVAAFAAAFASLAGLAACGGEAWPPDTEKVEPTSHVLAPEEALRSFYLPPGYRIELVASEPVIEDPVAIDFDADGRMYVAEMRGYMPDLDAEDERAPNGRISVLEDDDGDGVMDRSTVFLDSLVLPRAVKTVAGGVLIGVPPHLIFARDTDGDLEADESMIVNSDFGSARSNPEHNANGLLWGLDNCLHTGQHGSMFCAEDGEFIRNGRVVPTPTLFRGQWGVSMDDLGRFYRNFNEDPLHVDLVPATYFARNPDLARTRGAYEDLVSDKTVWPIRPNYGVNRGYRDHVLRNDGMLASFTAAGSPVVYRGEGYPSEVQGDVFVTEPAGNLVRRFAIEEVGGTLRARNAYDGAEFLTSSDERFRPVNLYSGPDGALYVVDMYRGVIQHQTYLTDYLKKHIHERNLQIPVGLGRIYRIVHESMERSERPRLSQASPKELVDQIDHPNGWWRDTVQRLLIERKDTTEAARLRKLALGADEDFTRLHALWTLDGLGILYPAELLAATFDDSPYVRAAAVRLSERRLSDPIIREGLDRLQSDDAPVVRRQLAATFGALPWPEKKEPLLRLLAASAGDSVVTDLVVSGLHGHEHEFLAVVAASEDSSLADAAAMLAAAHANAAGRGAARRLASEAAAGSPPAWLIDAVAKGSEMAAPDSDADENQAIIAGVDSARYAAGRALFEQTCGVCHGQDGTGLDGVAPTLVGSPWVTGPENRLIRIVLDGKEGERLMPAVQDLTDQEIADVLTFIRNAWGHQSSTVSADDIDMVRKITSDRTEPWTDAELLEIQ